MIVPFDFLSHLPAVLPEFALTLLAIIVLAADVGFLGIPPLAESRKGAIAYIAGFGLLACAFVPLAATPSHHCLNGSRIPRGWLIG